MSLFREELQGGTLRLLPWLNTKTEPGGLRINTLSARFRLLWTHVRTGSRVFFNCGITGRACLFSHFFYFLCHLRQPPKREAFLFIYLCYFYFLLQDVIRDAVLIKSWRATGLASDKGSEKD